MPHPRTTDHDEPATDRPEAPASDTDLDSLLELLTADALLAYPQDGCLDVEFDD